MSRLTLTLKNAWTALAFHIAYIIIQFYSRDIFLESLGDNFIGVVGTLKSILQFLNLSELGIGAAVGFSLYKPIYDKNKEKINEIIGYLGFLYQRIGIFVLVASVVLMLFFPLFFSETSINLGLIVFLFIALTTSNLLTYFFAYHTFLLAADQKGYMSIKISQSVFILRLILQCVVLLYFESVIMWIGLELLTPFLYIILVRKKIRKTYPWLLFRFKTTKEIRNRNKELLKKIKQLSFHKIGGFVSNGTDNIIIFFFINPATVAFVGNYQLLMNSVNTLANQFFNSTNAGVGSLVAENELNRMVKVFWEMMALRFFLGGTVALLLFIGFDDFITIWLGEKYLMADSILLALILVFFILQVRQPVDSFIQAHGLYGDVWAPLVQSVINLLVSIIFVIKFGVLGVFIGTVFSQIVVILIWRPYHLFHNGLKISVMKYWKGFCLHLIYLTLAGEIFYFVYDYLNLQSQSNILNLLIKLLKVGTIFSVIYFVILFILSKGFKDILNRFVRFAKNRYKK